VSYFDRQEMVIGSDASKKIETLKILVIGAGAGGNEVLKNLALMGFGFFTIVDFDPIEDSNLSRTTLFSIKDVGKSKAETAASKLSAISLHNSPIIRGVNKKIQDIGKQIFLSHDIVICCVDTMDARAYINDWCVILKKPLFEMGFERFTVQISFFPNECKTDSCLREIIGFGSQSGTRLQSCSKLKMADTKLVHIPTIQVAAALAGVLIASEIIMFLQTQSHLKNKMLQYIASNHRTMIVDIPQSSNCHLHEDLDHVICHTDLDPYKNSFRDLLYKLKEQKGNDVYICWSEIFIDSMDCEHCGKTMQIKRFISDVNDKERWCEECQIHYEVIPITKEWVINKELFLSNPNHNYFLNLPMSDYGVKKDDIIIVNNLQNETVRYLVLV